MREAAHSAAEGGGALLRSPPLLLKERWEALHAVSAMLARLADLSPERASAEVAAFPATIEDGGPHQRSLALQGIEDIEAMMEPGLAALEAIIARGGSPCAPALTLWREFHSAREALLDIARMAARFDAA